MYFNTMNSFLTTNVLVNSFKGADKIKPSFPQKLVILK